MFCIRLWVSTSGLIAYIIQMIWDVQYPCIFITDAILEHALHTAFPQVLQWCSLPQMLNFLSDIWQVLECNPTGFLDANNSSFHSIKILKVGATNLHIKSSLFFVIDNTTTSEFFWSLKILTRDWISKDIILLWFRD